MSTSAAGARSVFAADLDGDGDMDWSASFGDNKIAWYENTDGKDTFESQQVVSTSAEIIRIRLTWTEMETWTWQVLLNLTIKVHGTAAKALLEADRVDECGLCFICG